MRNKNMTINNYLLTKRCNTFNRVLNKFRKLIKDNDSIYILFKNTDLQTIKKIKAIYHD